MYIHIHAKVFFRFNRCLTCVTLRTPIRRFWVRNFQPSFSGLSFTVLICFFPQVTGLHVMKNVLTKSIYIDSWELQFLGQTQEAVEYVYVDRFSNELGCPSDVRGKTTVAVVLSVSNHLRAPTITYCNHVESFHVLAPGLSAYTYTGKPLGFFLFFFWATR